MSDGTAGILGLCLICLVPWLLGIGMTIFFQRRISRMGIPWAFLPGIIKSLWEHYQ